MSKTNLEVAKECGAWLQETQFLDECNRIEFNREQLDAYTSRICAEKDAEIREQIRLNGMGGEREARLIAENAELTRKLATYSENDKNGN